MNPFSDNEKIMIYSILQNVQYLHSLKPVERDDSDYWLGLVDRIIGLDDNYYGCIVTGRVFEKVSRMLRMEGLGSIKTFETHF